MSVSIRLSRGGAKKRPFYKIVVCDSRTARDGKFIERIGSYNPMLPKDSEERVKIDADRARHWLSVGAQPTDRVARFLDAAGVKERSTRNNPNKGAPGEKAQERAKERAERDEAAAAAAAEAAAEAAANPPAEENPVEETPVAETPADETATDDATNNGQSTSEPVEGGDDQTPAEGAEKAE